MACRRLLQYLVIGASSVYTSQGVRRENSLSYLGSFLLRIVEFNTKNNILK